MKNYKELKLQELEELGVFLGHIEQVLADMETYEEYLDKKDKRKFLRCHKELYDVWNKIQNKIIYLSDADERNK